MSWESGDEEPALEHLESLSQIYVCPVGHFILPSLPAVRPLLSFRGLAPEKSRESRLFLQQTLHRFLELAEWTASLVGEIGPEWGSTISTVGHFGVGDDSAAVAERERARLGFSPETRQEWTNKEEAFLWWRRAVEAQGIFCFQLKLDARYVRGAATWIANRYPFILVNQEDAESAPGRIFTLVHEYAHLLRHDEGVVCDFRGASRGSNPEPWANRFAARMLLSHHELAERLDQVGMHEQRERWSDETLGMICEPLFVSRDVVAIMLQDLRLAPEGFYQSKREAWGRKKPFGRGGRGITTNERTFRRLGYSLLRVLSRPDRAEPLPWTDLSYVLDMKVEKLDGFFRWIRARGDIGTAV
jgi:Zn-dependent peptidase ImmA (M78 family)